ncbi:MAG: ester cyclase [Thermoplasmata archaeon]
MASWEELSDGYLAALEARDEKKAGSYLTEDVNYWEANMPEAIHGREAVEAHLKENWDSFTDVHLKVLNRVESGEWGSDEGEWTGTNTGPIQMPNQTFPATGKQGKLWWVSIGKRSGDKLSELRVYYDGAGLFGQLGLMEPPGSE